MIRSQVVPPVAGIVDAHAHLGRWLSRGAWAVADVGALVRLMDTWNVRTVINLDGRWDEELQANINRYDLAYPGRFVTFCHVDWSELASPTPGRSLRDSLERSADAGARGLKVWKDLGLRVRDGAGDLVLPDDGRLGPLWEAAADRGMPVAIHTGDPPAFFDVVDERNERLEELLDNPDWSYADPSFPSFERLIAALERLVAAHGRTTFIGVHVGGYAEDLAWVGRMLERYDNFYVDIGARLNELGRQPRAAQALMLGHPDRILFATDGIPPDHAMYETGLRFLTTADEAFPYSADDPPPSGRWNISGVDLPAHVLARVLSNNATRILNLKEMG